MELIRFDSRLAASVASWARSPEEARAWCSYEDGTVPPEEVATWSRAPDVHAFLLVRDDEVVGYGETWVDDAEAEVELARIIVAPEHRGRGLGRELVGLLVERARRHYPTVVLRVRPGNDAALRCYGSAGFRRAAEAEQRAWNAGQPVEYVWMVLR